MSSRLGYAIAVFILLVSAGFHLVELTTLPQGFNDTEIGAIRLTETIRTGQISVFYELEDGNTEGLFHLVLTMISSIVGTGTIGFRILSVFLHLITLAMVYHIGRRLFNPTVGVFAMVSFGMIFWGALLARLTIPETMLPFLVSLTLLGLVHAIPRLSNRRTGNTVASAIVGATVGASFYVHPIGIWLFVLALLYTILYIITTPRDQQQRRRVRSYGYTIFALFVVLIVALPYIFSTLQNPEVSGINRLIHPDAASVDSILMGLRGFIQSGDANPIYNIPGNSLLHPLMSVAILLGILTAILNWQQARFLLVLVALVVLLVGVLMIAQQPSFSSYASILPIFALFFGIGINILFDSVRRSRWGTRILAFIFVLLVGGGMLTTHGQLRNEWKPRNDVKTAYSSDLAQIAHHLDTTIPTAEAIICQDEIDAENPEIREDQTITNVLMNRQDANLRFVNCKGAMLFIQGGTLGQVVVPNTDLVSDLHPELQAWVERGEYLRQNNLPVNSVLKLDVDTILADELGKFITTAPVRFQFNNAPENENPLINPPIRFGGNLTFLGYAQPEIVLQEPGEILSVVTYWRVEGVVPPDLNLFAHVLSDPATVAAQRDVIHIDPSTLTERDVFVQVTDIPLPENMIPGEYLVSVGAYQAESDQRLVVLLDDTESDIDQIYLYSVIITEPAE